MTAQRSWARPAILALTLLAFAHVALGLGAKDLWWDESLSLQRAEQGLFPLLRGVLLLRDGFTDQVTIDQHPFFSFLLQGALIRLAGDSEYALRFVSAAAATLMTPALYALGRLYARRAVIPPAAALWAALLAALSPFLLWYGQEARPYALWALLAVLTTHALLVATEGGRHARRWWIAYAALLPMFLFSHYYAVFLLPVHAALLYLALRRRSRARALAFALTLLLLGGAIAGIALWLVLRQGGGVNFPSVTLGILVPDLLNAFSLGLSVNIDDVRRLDWIFGAVAALGAVWMVRSRAAWASGGWVVPAALLVPVLVVFAGTWVQNIYMNARHLSLIAGPWLLLLGVGLATVARAGRRAGAWIAAALALLLLGGFAYSTLLYHTREEYAKDDFSTLGEYMDGRIMPGDAVLYYPPAAWRIFEYYVPMDTVHAAAQAGAPVAVHSVPLLDGPRDTFAWLEELGEQQRRVWVLKSGTHPYFDLEGKVETWLRDNFIQVRDAQFFSHSSLRAQLYLPQIPVVEDPPPAIPAPAGVTFDGNLHLAGTDADRSAWARGVYTLPLPVTLYWRVAERPERRARYILELVETVDGIARVLGRIEREPYEGDIPVTFWDPGRTILEFVELPHAPPTAAADLAFTFRMYDAETLAPLPITDSNGHPLAEDGVTVRIPFPSE